MSPIYFQQIDTYIIEHIPNLEFHTKETDFISISEGEWVSFTGYLWEDEKGAKHRCLYIFTQVAVEGELINSLFDQRGELGEDGQKQLAEIAYQKLTNLSPRAQNLINKFRWLTGLKFDKNLRGESIPLQWSRDRKVWEAAPTGPPREDWLIDAFHGHEPTAIIDKEFIDTVIAPNLHLKEPLGHDLLFEAERLFERRDIRGAFLLGFSALEIGVKEFISKMIPKATWLMENSPSPNIYEMCDKYLPKLDVRLSIENTPERKLINTYMSNRNKLAHRGIFKENDQTVLKKLKMVGYMLHRFDYCAGLERALLYANLAKEFMEELGLEELPEETADKAANKAKNSKKQKK